MTLGACSKNVAGARDALVLEGKVLHIHDESDVDGPIVIMIEASPGNTADLFFGSMFTRPPPDSSRRATFAAIRHTRVGDRVRARGSAMDGGHLARKPGKPGP
jgi:hypothetical protein